jgi:hypothetical protein
MGLFQVVNQNLLAPDYIRLISRAELAVISVVIDPQIWDGWDIGRDMEPLYLPSREERVRGKETGVFLDLAERDSSLVIVVQVACNGSRLDCIFAARTNQDVIGWIKREKIHYYN